MLSERPSYFNFVSEAMERWACERPEAMALRCVDEAAGCEQKFSFRQLAESARRAAAFFHTSIQRGDRVLLILPRVPQLPKTISGKIRWVELRQRA